MRIGNGVTPCGFNAGDDLDTWSFANPGNRTPVWTFIGIVQGRLRPVSAFHLHVSA